MKLAIASDHRGYEKKQKLIKFLISKGYNVDDFGTNNQDSVDYPDYAFEVAKKVSNNEYDFGILLCANGIGMSIAANKVKKIRCAKVSNVEEARHSRIDNDCNMIAIGANEPTIELEKMLLMFLTTKFNGEERFVRRIGKISDYEH